MCLCVWEWNIFLAIYCTSLTFGAVCCIFGKSGRHIRFHYNAKSLFSMPFKTHTYTHIYFPIYQQAYAFACQLISTTLSISLSLLFLPNCKCTNIFKSWSLFFWFSNFSFRLFLCFCCFAREDFNFENWQIISECFWNNST